MNLRISKPVQKIVFDSCCSTIDVSLFEIDGFNFTMKATAGDADIDKWVYEDLVANFYQEHGHDLTEPQYNKEGALILSTVVELNLALRMSKRHTIETSYEINNSVTRVYLKFVIAEQLAKLLVPQQEVVRKTGLGRTDISSLVMVGVRSRIAGVAKGVVNFMRRQGQQCRQGRSEEVTAEEAIGQGAALGAALSALRLGPPQEVAHRGAEGPLHHRLHPAGAVQGPGVIEKNPSKINSKRLECIFDRYLLIMLFCVLIH
jgi:molecular chaperone DnaK (HSP70)